MDMLSDSVNEGNKSEQNKNDRNSDSLVVPIIVSLSTSCALPNMLVPSESQHKSCLSKESN